MPRTDARAAQRSRTRDLRAGERDIDRELRQLERQEAKLMLDVKAAGKRGDASVSPRPFSVLFSLSLALFTDVRARANEPCTEAPCSIFF